MSLRTDLQLEVRADLFVNLQTDAGLGFYLEAWRRDGYGVLAIDVRGHGANRNPFLESQSGNGLRDRAARFEPIEGRGVDHGDTVTLDLERRDLGKRGGADTPAAAPTAAPTGAGDKHENVSVELGAKGSEPLGVDLVDAAAAGRPVRNQSGVLQHPEVL